MKSTLERAMVYVLNNESEKAKELFHEYIIEAARSIHESLREDDEEIEDTFFTEADLADAEDEIATDLDVDSAEKAEGDDLGDDGVDSDIDDEGMDSESFTDEDEIDAGAEDAPESSDELDEIGQELADLQSRFDELMAEMGEDEDEGGSEFDDVTDEVDADVDTDVDADADVDVDMGDDVYADEDEDFADIKESILDELKAISVSNEDGRHATGQGVANANKSSLKFNPKSTGKPTMTSGTNKTGFARETAPTSQETRGGSSKASSMRNVRKDADSKSMAVSKEADKKAILNKSTVGNDKSVIGSKKK